MTKRSHNKKRNVGIIYEQLVNYVTKALIENRLNDAAKAKQIITNHFNAGTQLYKEIKLFNAIVVTDVSDGSLATQILENAKGAARSHDTNTLRHEKNMLIKDINYNLGKDFYNTHVSNYRRYANVQVLFNEWRKFNKADISKVAEYENRVHAILMENKSSTKFEKNPDEINSSIVRIYTQKFNESFSEKLNIVQRDLLKEYAFGDRNLKNKLENLKIKTVQAIQDFVAVNDNQIINSKYEKVIKEIRNLRTTNVDDSDIQKYLSICGLFEEVNGEK